MDGRRGLKSVMLIRQASKMQSFLAKLSFASSLRSSGAQQENKTHPFTYVSSGSLLPGIPQGYFIDAIKDSTRSGGSHGDAG
jgi:hypothetical protein